MFKRNLALFVCLMLLILPLNLALAHGGRTDSNGGHYDRSTGEYHYHHGYPAHDHPGGVCPYDYDDQTDHSGGDNDLPSKSYSGSFLDRDYSKTDGPQFDYDEIFREAREGIEEDREAAKRSNDLSPTYDEWLKSDEGKQYIRENTGKISQQAKDSMQRQAEKHASAASTPLPSPSPTGSIGAQSTAGNEANPNVARPVIILALTALFIVCSVIYAKKSK